jgi:site-specific recombinase XerD
MDDMAGADLALGTMRVRQSTLSSFCAWLVAGITQLYPHGFRHCSAAELYRRTGGNLRAVQAHLRHSDIQTTTIYTEMTQSELQKVVNLFDDDGK